jgi:HEAT repeat protein
MKPQKSSRFLALLTVLLAIAVGTPSAAEEKERKPPQDIYYLLDLLKSPDVTERRDTARTLGVMGFDVATPALVEALDDTDPKVQLLAAEALGKIGDPHGVEPLLAKLPYAETGVKRFILGALGKIGDNRALEALVAALRDEPVAEVRASAAFGLGELGAAEATEPLLAALDDENEWTGPAGG